MDKVLKSILRRVERPSTYLGGEIGVCPITTEMRVRYCLCYPDLYYKAMSSFEVRVLYHLLNDRKGYACERCFAPYYDMAAELKKANMPLFSLETKTPLSQFDILGFAFNNELNYTTFLFMLSLAQIPLESKDRGADFPFVYGFSKCMVNPEPLAAFLDFVIIGDYEDTTIKVIDCVMKAKLSKLAKKDVLKQLSMIDGVYVPSLVNVTFSHGKLTKIEGKQVKRQVIRDLDRTYFPNKFMIANDEVENDGAFVEIMRGCDKGCRFCQEGYIDRPIREKRVQNLVAQATSQLVGSGNDELTLYSLESTSYKRLTSLASFIDPLCEERNAKWSVSNHRSQSFESSYKALKKSKNLTLSIEAASERLRKIINKEFPQNEIETSLKQAFNKGINSVKILLMIGLPFETSNDLMEIVNFCLRVKELFKEYHVGNRGLSLTISTSTFVPKAFTPFQWCSFIGVKEAGKRQTFLKYALDKIGVNYEHEQASESEISAILSRGDRNLCKMLMTALSRGAIFANDLVAVYDEAMSSCGLDKNVYLAKKDTKDVLPWDLIDILVTRKFLESEYKKSQKEEVTVACSHNCARCGMESMGVCKYGRC